MPFVVAAVVILILIVIVAGIKYFSDRDSTAKKKMLAVLPFENLGTVEQEYFADGITGEITSRLSGLSGLGVIARSSAMQYKKTQKSLHQIGQELGVQYVLGGTIQWEKLTDGRERVRVNPELIRIDNTTQIWSKPYEADFSSAFKLQADIAATVAEALNVTLIRSEKQFLEEKITENSEAYDTYLRALNYTEIIDDEQGLRIAEQLLLKAVSLDENFTAAYARLSSVQSDMYWMYFERTEECLTKSRANAQKALTLDPNLPEAHIAMANYYYHGRLVYESALKEYHEALRLQPSNVEANNGIGFVLRRQGKMREAVAALEKSLALDPRYYNTIFSVGETYVLLREYERALGFIDQALALTPDVIHAHHFKSLSYLYKDGDVEKARSVILSARERKIGLNSPMFIFILHLCDILDRNFEKALTQIKGIKQLDDQFNYISEDLLAAFIYRLMDNPSQAKENFESAARNLEKKIKQQAEDSRLYSSLGLAYAGMGRKTEAIQKGKHAVELLPVSREAWRGSFRLRDLAQIYTFVGEQELALDAIEKLIESPTDALSIWLLKLDPTWDPLRENPRFQKLIESIE
jgi:serine/threonine-protein kinase